MTQDVKASRQPLITSWLVQMVGTIVLAGVVLVFVRSQGAPFPTQSEDWKRYAMFAVVVAGAPALVYLRHYKRLLDEDERVFRQRGMPDPKLRATLAKALLLGGALCELPMALGVVQLFFGGDTRWFLGATMVTIALRLSFRPFNR